MKKKLLPSVFLLCISPGICLPADDSSNVRTRHGILSVNYANILELNGAIIKPETVGNNGLALLDKISLDASDVILVRDDGGEACPAMYYFATIGPGGATISDRFGSCSDLAKIKVIGRAIFVTMPDYTGDIDSRTAVAKHTCRYKYENGAIRQLPQLNGHQPCAGD